ncbi:hypothetical protein NCTC86R_2000006 [Escherichia coli]|nr:hypothetical protein NCTC86R_2000006 [Escherichia coli]
MTSLKTSIKTITYLSDIGCLEIQGASLVLRLRKHGIRIATSSVDIRENLTETTCRILVYFLT